MKEHDVDPNQILPELTEEGPKIRTDKNPIEKVIIPKEGGIKTWVRGHNVPFPGYRNREVSKIVEIVKRSLRMSIDALYVTIKKGGKIMKIVKFFMLRKKIKRFISHWLKFASWAFRSYKYKPKLYSKPVREMYRLFNIIIEREKTMKMKDRWRRARDVVCMIAEVDQGYRFRLQDILSELKPEEMELSEDDEYFLPGGYNFGGKEEKENEKN